MKRVEDKPYYTYYFSGALSSGVNVKCPKCHGFGAVTADKNTAFFKCTACGYSQERECAVYRYDVQNLCKCCGRYYRVDIKDEDRQHFKVLNVACPFCAAVMPGRVQRVKESCYYIGEIRNGYEPYFGLELWFLSAFQDRPVWALNREHLAYLIDYLDADLRESPAEYRARYGTMRTQSDHLPTFMKTAKNRGRIVKILREMQDK